MGGIVLRRRTAAVGAVVGAVLLLGACSSDGDNDSSKDRSGAVEAPAAAPTMGNAAPDAAGTGSGAGTGAGSAPSKAPAGSPSGAPAANNAPAVQDRKLVLTADVRLEAADPEAAAANARSITIGMGGLVAGEQTTRSPRTVTVPPPPGSSEPARQQTVYVTTSSLTLKVPPAQFDKALDQFSSLGTVIGRNRTATDITEQVVDVQSRIETQRRSVERVRDLLAKATSLSEIVSLEAEVTRREADLESLLKRQQTLTAQSDLATIALVLNSPPEPTPDNQPPKEPKKKDDESFGGAIVDALGDGWNAFYVTTKVILVVLSAVLPFLVVLLLVVWLWRRYGGPLRGWIAQRRAAKEEPFIDWRARTASKSVKSPHADDESDDGGRPEHEPAGAGAAGGAPSPPPPPPSAPPRTP